MVMSPGWPIGRIPPFIVTWRAAPIRRIGAGRLMGCWGDWSRPERLAQTGGYLEFQLHVKNKKSGIARNLRAIM